MSEVDDTTQANVALTLEEKITDRVRSALVEVLRRGNADVYVQDVINERIRQDTSSVLADPSIWQYNYNLRAMVKEIVKEVIIEQMHKY